MFNILMMQPRMTSFSDISVLIYSKEHNELNSVAVGTQGRCKSFISLSLNK